MKEKLVQHEVLPTEDDEDVLFTRESARSESKYSIRNKAMLSSAVALFLMLTGTLAVAGYQKDFISNVGLPFQKHNEIKDCPIQPFDYLMMVFRWAPSVCLEGPCVPHYPESWVIHGLWPNFWDGKWPQNCCPSDKFNVKKIKSIEDRMLKVWPNLYPGKTADSLWAHEWGKHGTCSAQTKQLVGEFNYFNNTLTLYNGWPLQQWLEDAGIKPDNNTIIAETKFSDAVGKHIPNKVMIHCENVKGTSNVYIDSIGVCLDKTSLTPIDCPTNSDTCKKGLIYPQAGNNS